MRWHLSRHVVVLFSALIALSTSTGVAAAQFLDPLGAVVFVGDAEPQTSEPRLFRIYETPAQLTLLLTLVNRSSRTVLVDRTGLERDVRFTVNRSGRSISISARWNRDARQAGLDAPVAVSPGGSFRIEAGKRIEWRIDLQPADGKTFPSGRYAIEVAMGDTRGYVATGPGQPWLGVAPWTAPVTVLIAPAATAQERAAAFLLAGDIALRGNRQAEAVQAFQRARAVDPADRLSMIALGNAYLLSKRYAEAIVEFENALRISRGHRSSVPSGLALAYLALGDESSAARVLREAGVAESKIPSDLDRFRSTIRARK